MNNTDTKSKQAIEQELRNFSGTTKYYRYSPRLFPTFFLTDGTNYVAEICGTYCLFDYIASQQMNPIIRDHPKLQEIQFWTLTVQGLKGIIICEWDSDQVVFQEKLQFITFPLDSISVWVAPLYLSPDDIAPPRKLVAYLPSEH